MEMVINSYNHSLCNTMPTSCHH